MGAGYCDSAKSKVTKAEDSAYKTAVIHGQWLEEASVFHTKLNVKGKWVAICTKRVTELMPSRATICFSNLKVIRDKYFWLSGTPTIYLNGCQVSKYEEMEDCKLKFILLGGNSLGEKGYRTGSSFLLPSCVMHYVRHCLKSNVTFV